VAGEYRRALNLLQARLQDRPLPADFALAGDLFAAIGRADEAERHYRLAEALWRSDVPEPSRLARFLAERGRNLEDAVRLAESTFADRRDIFTADARAWAYFQTGRLDRAQAAIKDALRTGTRDRIVLYHAAAIEHAAGHRDAAARLVAKSLENAPRFDLIAAPAAAALARTISQPQLARR
jgi:tetratricopeptide (TPR) repeat protein